MVRLRARRSVASSVDCESVESYWPAVARGDEEAPPAMREWAVKLEAKPKYVVSSTRTDFPWTNSHHIAGDLRTGVQELKDATPAGVLLGSGKLARVLMISNDRDHPRPLDPPPPQEPHLDRLRQEHVTEERERQ